MPAEAIARQAYDALAEGYAARIDTKAHNALYERPATLSLLPPLSGKRVLDAGCGAGKYAELLLEAGAEVVGVDVSAKMLAMARRRLPPGRVSLVQADLGQKLDFLADGSFDLVVCALVLDHILDWRQLFAEFNRILKPNGVLVYSATHPFVAYLQNHWGGNYFQVERTDVEWRGFGPAVLMPGYRRSFSEMVTPLLETGFMLETVLEPRPQPAFQAADPREYDKLMRQPGFICVRGKKHTAV